MDRTWLLLIYTVPAEPSRKRAFIWREVKKVGAVYLRDGVCALPEQPETARSLRAIAAKVQEFEGEATLVRGARLDPARADCLVSRSRESRAEEYADIAHEAERLLEHVARETEHRDFTFAELEQLEADLGKLNIDTGGESGLTFRPLVTARPRRASSASVLAVCLPTTHRAAPQ